MKQRVVWGIPRASPSPSFSHKIFTLWLQINSEKFKIGTQRNEQLVLGPRLIDIILIYHKSSFSQGYLVKAFIREDLFFLEI